jgi:hypothetical protein
MFTAGKRYRLLAIPLLIAGLALVGCTSDDGDDDDNNN